MFIINQTDATRFSKPLNLKVKTAALNIQSMNIPYQIPITPSLHMYTNRYANPMRKVHMENTDTAMVNLASREALRVWGMVNAKGHTSMAILWAVIRQP